jgi:type I restriction enzyme S subunit
MKIKISEILDRVKDSIEIKNDIFYKRLTIKINHQGVTVRDIVKGSNIGTKNQFKVAGGDFILSKIDARQGAFGIVPDDGDGAVITGNFWTYKLVSNKVNIDWFLCFTRSDNFLDLCKRSSVGNTHRKYLNEDIFLNHVLDVPSLSDQIKVIQRLNSIENYYLKIQGEIKHQENYFERLRKSILFDALCGKLTIDWRASNKSKDIHKLPNNHSFGLPSKLPNTWTSSSLGEVSQLISGASFLSTDFCKGNGIKCIKITNAGVRELVETDDVLPLIFAEKYKNNRVHKGDLILALTRPYISNGLKVSICPSSYDGALLNQRVAGIRLKEEILLNEFAFLFMRSDAVLKIYQAEFDEKGQQPNLKNEHVTNLIVPIPPLAEQAEIIAKVAKLEKYLDHAVREINSIREAKDMLNKAMLKEAFSPASCE